MSGDPRDVPETACGSCGAVWSNGDHTGGCAECGGGAMSRSCAWCDGVCGETWTRRVIDSWDEREAQWVGGCAAKCSSCGAAWGTMKHTVGCDECGGGSLMARCPDCDGACGVFRERDVAASWRAHRAVWKNACGRGA